MDAPQAATGGGSRAALKRKKKRKAQPLVAQAPSKKGGKKKKKRPKDAAPAEIAPPAPAPPTTSSAILDVADAAGAGSDDVAKAVAGRGLEDTDARARRVLRALLAPVGARRFYAEYFERRALLATGRPV